MSFTTHGSAASSLDVRLMTNQEFADEFGGDEPFENEADEQIVVLVDNGNMLAYVIDGSPRELSAFGHLIADAANEMRRT